MHLTQFPVLLFVWTMTAGFTRGKNTTKQPGEEANAPQRRQGPLLAGRGFLPRPGPASFPGPQKRNDTDAIVIEHGDGDNSKLPPFIFRPVPIIPPRTCQKEHSCLNRCSNTRQFQNVTAKKKFFSCFCDPECHTIFHDCCADYERYCQESGAQGHENNTAEMKKWDCLMVKGKDLGIWMIKTCAKDWPSDEARLKCENMSNKLGKFTIELLNVTDTAGFVVCFGCCNTSVANINIQITLADDTWQKHQRASDSLPKR